MRDTGGVLNAVWVAIGVLALALGRRERACALEELGGGRPTDYPLGARYQLVGDWLLLVFGVGFILGGLFGLVRGS